MTSREPRQAREPGARSPEPRWFLPVLVASADGYRNLCRLVTRMKLRAPKGEGALALDELDGHTGGLVALAGREVLRARRYGVGGLLDRLVGIFGRGERLRGAAAASPARRGGRQRARSSISPGRTTCRSSPPTACGSPRPRIVRSSTCSRASTTASRSTRAGRRLARERRAVPEDAGADGGALQRSAAGDRRHRRARRSAAVHDGRSRLSLSRLSGARGRDADRRSCGASRRSARASGIARTTIAHARRSRASSISSRSWISPATS